MTTNQPSSSPSVAEPASVSVDASLASAASYGVPASVFESLSKRFGEGASRDALMTLQVSEAYAKRDVLGKVDGRAKTTPNRAAQDVADQADAPMAPWPLVDRYQTVLGSRLTLDTISAILRTCSTGYRTYYVDLLDELMEREPHGYAVLQQRLLAVAGARLEFVAAKLAKDDPRVEKAREIAEFVEAAILGIPNLVQALVDLLWALYYGVSALEISWKRDKLGRLVPGRLHFIHSRRLNYPSWNDWDIRILDQGVVTGFDDFGHGPTQQIFGLRCRDFPGKFIVHAPRLRGSYPTREGLGRETVWWFALKGMAARSAGIYIERFAKPWPVATYQTGQAKDQPRAANARDIDVAKAAVNALGTGTGATAVLPDSIVLDLFGPGTSSGANAGITHLEFIDFCNAEISKAVLGQTLTTESGKRGNTSATSVHQDGKKELMRFDASCLVETLRADLVRWLVSFNFPGDEDLIPTLRLLTDEEPSPGDIADVLVKAVTAGLPVDADAVADMLGLPLVPNDEVDDEGDVAKRRCVLAMPIDPSRVNGAELAEPPQPQPPTFGGDDEDEEDDKPGASSKGAAVKPGAKKPNAPKSSAKQKAAKAAKPKPAAK